MYLVSIYFDEKTNKKIQRYIDKVAEKTGNTFMTGEKVPPHMTISAFETAREDLAVKAFEEVVSTLQAGELYWASVGQFLPYVIYVTPVLNRYLQEMAEKICEGFSKQEEIQISPYYRPFQWMPHTTIGKKLSKEEMQKAFEVLQESFAPFEGRVVRIGLAKPNPHRDIVSFEL